MLFLKVIKSNKNKFIKSLFTLYHRRLLKNHFYRIHLAGKENLFVADSSLPVIMYANHTNWWDGFIAFELTSNHLKADDYLMMDIEQMRKYRFFKYIGVFSVNRSDARDGVESINYAAELLGGTNRYLWIFPQGEMFVQDRLPLKFYTGITRIAEKLGRVNLIPAAFRYEFVKEQRPEVFINIGTPETVNNNIDDVKACTARLQDKLTAGLAELREAVISQNLAGYEVIFTGKHSRNKTVDRLYR